MARLNLNIPRTSDTIELHLGKVLLFCEGRTEENYFNYFSNIIKKDKIKYADLEVHCTCAEGNAKQVFNFAEDFLNNEENAADYREFEKCLIFDCDSPENIQQVIFDMDSKQIYTIYCTNILFETWLLMHYEYLKANSRLRKGVTFKKLADHLRIPEYTDKEKNDPGLIRSIIENSASVQFAIKNAERLRMKYSSSINDTDYDIISEITSYNPYTNVDKLVKTILYEMSMS